MKSTRGGPGGTGETFWAPGVRGTQGGASGTSETFSAPDVVAVEGAGGGAVPARLLEAFVAPNKKGA